MMVSTTEPHVTALGAARYLDGELSAEDAARLEAHVSSCAECAAVLTSEARLHLVMQAVATRIEPTPERIAPVTKLRARRAWAWGLAAAAAVALAILWRWPSSPPPPLAHRAHPSCLADRSECAVLEREGRVPEEMLLAGEVWRYEEPRPRRQRPSEWLVSAEPAWEGP